jgi:hypothetical protein
MSDPDGELLCVVVLGLAILLGLALGYLTGRAVYTTFGRRFEETEDRTDRPRDPLPIALESDLAPPAPRSTPSDPSLLGTVVVGLVLLGALSGALKALAGDGTRRRPEP